MAPSRTDSDWAKAAITRLYTAPPKEFAAAFDAFVGKGAKITYNGVETSRDEYKKIFIKEKEKEIRADVVFAGAVDAPVFNIDVKSVSIAYMWNAENADKVPPGRRGWCFLQRCHPQEHSEHFRTCRRERRIVHVHLVRNLSLFTNIFHVTFLMIS